MTESSAGVVVVGTGHAGVQLATALRRHGWDAGITLVGAEPHLPYQRPPLSKAVLGADGGDSPVFHDAGFYDSHGIELVLGERAVAIERSARQVRLGSGRELGYRHLVLATGARARTLSTAPAGVAGILELRSYDDACRLRAELHSGRVRSAVLVGGGFIGLEVATVAAGLGIEVAVVDPVPRLLPAALSELTAGFLQARHRAAGVRFQLGQGVARVEIDGGRVRSVVTSTGDVLPADLVVLGVGVQPETGLAADAGLPVADGIVVDAFLGTADPAILAVGDCARFPHGDGLIRLGSVQNAFDMATHVARTLATGESSPYAAVPWFWSDQAGVKVQMAGLPADGAGERIEVEGSVEEGRFAVHRYRDGRFVGGESVGLPAVHLAMRRRLAAERPAVSPAR